MYLLNMTQQLHVAGLPQAIEDGYFDTANTPLHSSEVRMLTRGHGLTYLGQLE